MVCILQKDALKIYMPHDKIRILYKYMDNVLVTHGLEHCTCKIPNITDITN